jgi:sulfoxide reductase heme-binding subunit YedZ
MTIAGRDAQTPLDGAALVRRGLKPAVFVLGCLPLAWLVAAAAGGNLGVNPIEYVIRFNGDWALRFLLIALAVTPVRLLTGWADIGRVRRMLGLFAFFYVCLHILAYVGLDQFFDWAAIWKDVVKRVYITIGMAAFVTLVPLAVTSTAGMVRRLGARTWRRLHRSVYAVAVAGIVHHIMMLKTGYQEPALYAAILAVLLAVRAVKKWP